MLAGKWFHRKDKQGNRIPPHHREVRVADGDADVVAGAGAAAGVARGRAHKWRLVISPQARRPKT